MSRIERISQIPAAKARIRNAEEDKKLREFEALMERIGELSPRIAELIDTAEACLDAGAVITDIPYWKKDKKYRHRRFCTDGINHDLGFILTNKDTHNSYADKTSLGIMNGGFCGEIDLLVTKNNVFGIDRSKRLGVSKNLLVDPRTEDMKKFLEQFDDFEGEFYEAVDKELDSYGID